jgi:hypothetical protein
MPRPIPATSTSSPSTAPDFGTWSNAARFTLVERLLKAIVDELPDPGRCAPVVSIAKALIGRVRFAGHREALIDARVLAVDVAAMPNAARWVWAIVLCEWVAESWDGAEVEAYEAGADFDALLREMAQVDAALLLGGAR